MSMRVVGVVPGIEFADEDHHLLDVLGSRPDPARQSVEEAGRPRIKSKNAIAVVLATCCLLGVAIWRFSAGGSKVAADVSTVEQEVAVWLPPTETQTTTYTTTKPFGPSPSLFCWSHMQPGTSEVPLLRLQLVKRANIFACNYAVVISTQKMLVGNMDGIEVWTWVNEATETPMGQNGVDGSTTDSFLNTEVFLFAWETVMASQQAWPYDFVVKVDPDSIFFPDRLRRHIEDHTGERVYFSNCGKYGGKVLLYGSLEVFSVPALRLYEQRMVECKKLPWHGWGEDYYMQQCMDMMGVTNVPDTLQVGDNRCVAAECWDSTRVAFHDFKDPADWYKCFKQATES